MTRRSTREEIAAQARAKRAAYTAEDYRAAILRLAHAWGEWLKDDNRWPSDEFLNAASDLVGMIEGGDEAVMGEWAREEGP